MRVYVSGASGFVGAHVARELRARGAEVRDDRVDLLDDVALERAVSGCDAVVHVAALYSYSAAAERIAQVNVDGTRRLLRACIRRGVRRVVHTSTSGTCGPVAGRAATEHDAPPAWELTVPYKRTKLEAERLALAASGEGFDVVVVNPTTPVGDGDHKPTPTGRVVADVARGRMPGYLRGGGLNVVDVHDVACGHALALEHGRAGRRYLLGGVDCTLQELFALIARLAGRPAPRLRIPYPLARAAGAVGLVNRQEVLLARLPMYFSSARAADELGYRPGPIEPALARAVHEVVAQRRPVRHRPRAAYRPHA